MSPPRMKEIESAWALAARARGRHTRAALMRRFMGRTFLWGVSGRGQEVADAARRRPSLVCGYLPAGAVTPRLHERPALRRPRDDHHPGEALRQPAQVDRRPQEPAAED